MSEEVTKCEVCGVDLQQKARGPKRKTCSDKCRQAKHQRKKLRGA